MNNVNYDGFGYPDMNLINNIFLQGNRPNNTMNNTQDKNLAQPYEGYIRGNLYNSLYDQYKNYQPARLVPKNEQAELLLNVNQTTFAAHEIKLYLDIYPNDTSMIHLYNDYQKMASEAIKNYEKKYGPILADSPSEGNTFSWEAYAWPWEMEEL